MFLAEKILSELWEVCKITARVGTLHQYLLERLNFFIVFFFISFFILIANKNVFSVAK